MLGAADIFVHMTLKHIGILIASKKWDIGRRLAFCLVAAIPATQVFAQSCWEEAGHRYGVAPQLLVAIAKVESSLRPDAINNNHRKQTKSYDIGLMQINSRWIPTLAKYGITEKDLYEPCTNVHVGAWILASQFSRMGLSWDSVGAYNAACTQLRGKECEEARAKYARKVYRNIGSGS